MGSSPHQIAGRHRIARIPSSWPEYEIEVTNPERRCRGVRRAALDDSRVDPWKIPLVDDGGTHRVRVVLGEPEAV